MLKEEQLNAAKKQIEQLGQDVTALEHSNQELSKLIHEKTNSINSKDRVYAETIESLNYKLRQKQTELGSALADFSTAEFKYLNTIEDLQQKIKHY